MMFQSHLAIYNLRCSKNAILLWALLNEGRRLVAYVSIFA